MLQLANGSYCPMVVTSNLDVEGQQQMLMQHDARDGAKADMIKAAALRLGQEL